MSTRPPSRSRWSRPVRPASPPSPPLGGRLRGRVALEEQRLALGVLAHVHVRGHDRAGEAAVAYRVEHVLAGLLAHVEVRSVAALPALDLAGRLGPEGVRGVERVAAGAAVAEQDGALVHLRAVAAGYLDLAPAARCERGAGHD